MLNTIQRARARQCCLRSWPQTGCPLVHHDLISRHRFLKTKAVELSPGRAHGTVASDERVAMTQSPLEAHLSLVLEKRRRESRFRSLKTSPIGSTDLSSNDFLSLSTNDSFRREYLGALNSSHFSLGSTGSRLLDGNSTYAEKLETEIAAFHGAEAGLLTNSGFDANVSIFTCLPQPGDIIVYDELIHASVHDGMRQSRAKQSVRFEHNDVEDLRDVLNNVKTENPQANVFVAVESVYSMEGDLAPLREISDLLDDTFADGRAHLIVDEAHATGIYGPKGVGRVSELGLESRVSIRLHTFGKALACNGAIILSSPTIRLYLINYARPLIYTTFMSYPSLLAVRTAYDWLKNGTTESLSSRLDTLIQHLHEKLQTLVPIAQLLPEPSLLAVPGDCPRSPIFALLSTKPRELASHCQSAGFIVRAVVPPTVPEGTERVRVCLHAGNTAEEIDNFIACVADWVKAQAVLAASEKGNDEVQAEDVRQQSMRFVGAPGSSPELRTDALISKL